MYKQKYSTPFLFCLVLIGMGAISGCGDSITTFDYDGTEDVFCDGQSVSVVLTDVSQVSGQRPQYGMGHGGGGYLVSDTRHSWLINWSIQDKSSASVPSVRYVGRYEKKRSESGKKGFILTGVHPRAIVGIGNPEIMVARGKQLRVLDNGVARLPDNEILLDNNKNARPHGYIFTRKRKHVFAWRPVPAIYSLPDMKMIKKFNSTESFKEFTKHYRWREKRSVILTEDLSYLIAVPQNGSVSETQRGNESTKAFCYQTERDEVSAIGLNGLGDATIEDAEMVEDKLNWLVRRGRYLTDDWVILDSQSQTIADIKLPLAPEHQRYYQYWDPKNNLIWIVKFAPQKGDYSKAFSVIKHNISDGTRVEIPLPAFDESQLVVPE